MNIVFVSNFLNHHAVPLCAKLRQRCADFHFIATEEISAIGYQRATSADYVVKHYDEQTREKTEQLIIEADAVIFGSCPNELIALRMKHNKLSFLYSERFFKKGVWRRFIPSSRRYVMERIVQYKDAPLYVLSASAYLPYELSLLGYPRSKCYRWGYFPEVKKYESISELIRQKRPASILWVGRLIDWKHPELAIYIAQKLRKANRKFDMKIIGSGDLESKLEKMIRQHDLGDCVHMLGSMETDKVREYMEQASIFLFTSDRREGWGAVLNEAMNSGCAVVANRAIGSVPYLLEHGQNGLIYETEPEAFRLVTALLDKPDLCYQYGMTAYGSITRNWTAEIAAERLINIIRELKTKHSCDLYTNGPCSNERSTI